VTNGTRFIPSFRVYIGFYADVEQNVQLFAEQLRGVENVEQGQREIRHHEAPDADGGGQVSRFVAAAYGIHIGVSGPVRK